ncbi:hypothetical protein AB0H73_06570 [Streptomyces olivoreticuli]
MPVVLGRERGSGADPFRRIDQKKLQAGATPTGDLAQMDGDERAGGSGSYHRDCVLVLVRLLKQLLPPADVFSTNSMDYMRMGPDGYAHVRRA